MQRKWLRSALLQQNEVPENNKGFDPDFRENAFVRNEAQRHEAE